MRKYTENQTETLTYNDLLQKEKRKTVLLKGISIVLATVCLLSFIMIVIISSYPKSQGYVIEITPDGEATTDRDAVTLLEKWSPKDNTVNYFLRNFTLRLRSVSSDTQINTQNVQLLYRQIAGGSKAETKAKEFFKNNPPNDIAKQNTTVQVKVSAIVPLSDTSYQIDWRETTWASGTRLTSDMSYRMVVHTEFYTPKTVEQAAYNPIGLYITDFDITLIKEI